MNGWIIMKKQFNLFVMLLIIVLSIFNLANRTLIPSVTATYVEGPITQDTIWMLLDSPLVVSNNITVFSNATLTIEPGVEVKFGGYFSIVVSGKLYANGTSKTITFTSNKEQPESGDWEAIKFNGIEKSTLIGCSIVHAENGILIENGNVEIENSTISLSQNAITVNNGRLMIQNSIIAENQGDGICITGNGQVTIQKNTIIANGNGILLTSDEASNVNISQNRISANTASGIQIDANSHTNISIVDNTVSSNAKGFYISSPTSTYMSNNSISYNKIGILYDIGNHLASYNDIYGNEMGMNVLPNATVNAEYNYWGDPSGPYHESLNPTGKGDPVGGDGVNLDFIFFLTKPIGSINLRPTANLIPDKIWVSPNNAVTFFATNSNDSDGQVDRYFFNFDDGKDSGWTTLSVFSHKYSSSGIYLVNLKVMDDYGAISSFASVIINVVDGNPPPLYVSLVLSNSTVSEGEQSLVTVYVTNGTTAVQNAKIALFSFKGGAFAQSTGFTDSSGYFVTNFTAPDLTDERNIRIVARASKDGIQYVDGSDSKYLLVFPFLSVQIAGNPNVVESEETSQVIVHVASNGQPVSNASIIVSSDGGHFSSETGTTDLNGELSLAFIAPQTTAFLNVNITAIATKDKYMNGIGRASITVEPKVIVVEITATSNVTISGAKLNVTVHLEHDMTSIAGAKVTMTAENGNFSVTTDLTDAYGNVTAIFTTPEVNEQTNITMTAYATMAGYAEAQAQLEITVNPKTFYVQIIAPTVESGRSAMVTVLVTCNEDATPVANATVTMSSANGAFEVSTKTTDSTGTCAFVFNAPKTTAGLSLIITANVTKNGYMDGGSQTTMAVTKTISQAEGGWLLTMMLLIIISAAIVVIVAVLIKLKIIVISVREET